MESNFHSEVSTGYFGKLPEFPDFIKYNAAGDEILVLDKWLQDSMINAKNKLGQEWKKYYKNLPGFNFFYPFTGTENFITGTMFPGYDKTEREFPFIMFFNVNRNLPDNIPDYIIPLEFSEVYEDLNRLFDEYAEKKDIKFLNERIISLSNSFSFHDNIQEYLYFLSNTSHIEFFRRISGRQDASNWFIFINCFVGALIEQRNNTGKDNSGNFRISFPSGQNKLGLDLGFLIQLCRIVLNNNKFLPSLFWSFKNNNVCLNIIFNNHSSENFVEIISGTGHTDKIKETEDEIKLNHITEQLYEKIFQSGMSLTDMLEALKQIEIPQ